MADKTPYGNVTYADPGYQDDDQKRYPLDTEEHVRAAWSYINMPKNAAKYTSGQLGTIKSKIKAAASRLGIQITSSSESDVVSLNQRAVETVALDSELLEAKESEAGHRIYGIKVISYGLSKNGRRYPESVMRTAAKKYEGAKVYDHHRTESEIRTSTINGVVGFLRNVEPQGDGLYADLHLLPSATHAAEALDASLTLQQENLTPLVGISHDVLARFVSKRENNQTVHEATSIEAVQSADIVARPAAGGGAIRAIASEDEPEEFVEELAEEASNDVEDTTTEAAASKSKSSGEPDADDMPSSSKSKGGGMPPLDSAANCKAAMAWVNSHAKQLGPDRTAALKEKIQAAMDKLNNSSAKENEEVVETPTDETHATETVERTVEAETYPKAGWLARAMVERKCADAEMPKEAVEAVMGALAARFTESDVDAQIALGKSWMAKLERTALKPTLPKAGEGVTQESFDKKKKALDDFFDGNFRDGYHSFRQAYADLTGNQPDISEDYSRKILQESIGYRPENRLTRSTESMDSTTWNLVLGDSITRKMVAEYSQPELRDWQAIVSSTVPVNDFRTQRIDRIGGYDLLPGVNQGAPYQPLVSPTNEEVTYALTKRGGTEDITLEMISNDDVRSISRIPSKLGLSAALTLHRFTWGLLTGTANIFDSTALFTSNHGNQAGSPGVPSQTSMAAARKKMRKQLSYGDSNNILSIVPRTLIVPTSYEEIAFQLTRSAVAVPSTAAGPSDTPNINAGLSYLVLDHLFDNADSSTFWYLVADPRKVPTIELGFYQGRDIPELFTQADDSVGSMFDADKLTYKIRHIYSGAVLDYRGFFQTAVA